MLHYTVTVLSVCLFPFKYRTPREKKKHTFLNDLPGQSRPEDSSQLKKTVMFVRKLNCPQPAEKTPFLRVFRATKARSGRGGRTRATGKSPCLLHAWIRSPEKKWEKKITTVLQAEYLRSTCVAGADRGRERRGEGARVNSFQLVFSLVCRRNNTEFDSSIQMAILRTTLSDIRTWQKNCFSVQDTLDEIKICNFNPL